MRFSGLPIELVYQVAEHLEFERDINALVRTNKRCYSALNGSLYRHNIKEWDAAAFKSACKSGISNSMRFFLNEGMSPDAPNRKGRPIDLAAMYGREDIVKCLLEEGVDPNSEPTTAEAMEVLARLYAENGDRCMLRGPFDLAVRYGHEGTARLLVPHMKTVDYFVIEEPSMTPLALAAQNGHLNLVKFLVEELNCNVEPIVLDDDDVITRREMSPLAFAAKGGHTDVVRYLVGAGTDPNAITGDSWKTILGYALDSNHFETVEALIDLGSNPDPLIVMEQAKTMFWDEVDLASQAAYLKAKIGIQRPLDDANFRGNQEMMKPLFQYIDLERIGGSDIEDAGFLLPVAAACGLDCIVQRILEKARDANANFDPKNAPRKSCASTALGYASRYGHTGVVRILLDHGTDPNPRSEGIPWRLWPISQAAEAGHQQVVETLIEAAAKSNKIDNLLLIPAARFEPTFSLLLKYGADPSALDFTWRTHPLRQMMESQNLSMMGSLLHTNYGLSIITDGYCRKNAIQMTGEGGAAAFECMMENLWHPYGYEPSPYDYDWLLGIGCAIMSQDAEVVELFLARYGHKVELENSKNAVEYSVWAAEHSDITDRARAEATLDVLQRYGADINASRSDGQTCLSELIDRKNVLGAELVIKRGAKYPLTCVNAGKYLLSLAVERTGFRLLGLLLILIDSQGITSEQIEPHLKQLEAKIPACRNKLTRLRLERPIRYFRCRRMYPVPDS